MSGQYGFKTYDDMNKAISEFIKLLPTCATLEEVDGLTKGLTLAYLNYKTDSKAEEIIIVQKYKYLMREALGKEASLIINQAGEPS